ncbi:MAG: hypothetical protein FWC41_08205 [Firmicutes bacterium]|nr:hypothetical protein [Bacillota bacterium]
MRQESFGIIGSDPRLKFLSKILIKDGHKTIFFKGNNLKNLILENDNIILPIPVSRDGTNITGTEININQSLFKGKNIFCGHQEEVESEFWNSLDILDYSKSEEFISANAELTAHGTLKILAEMITKPFNELKILMTGFGRIGKIFTKLLQGLGSKISVLNYKQEDTIWSKIFGVKFFDMEEIIDSNIDFDFIINTAPSMIFSKKVLKNLYKKSFKKTHFIDLASKPGIDEKACKEIDFKIDVILGIPGKFFPEKSAEIIKKSIYEIMKI